MKTIVTFRNLLSVLVFLLSIILFIECTTSDNTDFSVAPSSPETVLVLRKDRGVVELSWVAPKNSGKMADGTSAPIVEYTVEFSKFENFESSIKQVSNKNSLRISELEENGTTYYFRVSAISGSKKPKGTNSSVVKITLGTISKATSPQPPKNLFINSSSLSGSTATLSWFVPSNIGKLKDGQTDASIKAYKIEYSKSENFTPFKEVLSKDTNTTYVLNNLEPLTKYFVRLLARNNSEDLAKEWSQPSNVIEFKTLELSSTPPSPPTNFAVKDIGDTYVTFTWLPPKDKGTENGNKPSDIIGYEIEYSLTTNFSADTKKATLPDGSLKEVTIKKLTPYKNYYARIRAINGNTFEKKSLYSLPIQGGFMTTKPPGAGEASKSLPPSNLNIPSSKVDETAALVVWSQPENFGKTSTGEDASIIEYTLEYSNNKNFNNKKIINISRITETTRVITGLKVSTTYYVRIKARNNNKVLGLDESEYANLASGFKTLTPIPPLVPSNPNVILKPGSEKTSVVFSWEFDAVNGLGFKGDQQTKATLKGFEIEYSTDGFQKDITKISIFEVDQRRVDINDLTPSTQYDFRIRSYNDNNISSSERKEAVSDWTNSISITTRGDPMPPSPPTGLLLTNPSDELEARTSLKFSWNSPPNPGKNINGIESVITKYVIEYTSDSFSNSEKLSKIEAFGGATNSIIPNLSPNTLYNVRMKAINSNLDLDSKVSKMTEVVSKKTNDLGSRPKPPKPIKQNSENISNVEGVNFVWTDVIDIGSNPDGNNDDLQIVDYGYRIYKAADATNQSIVTETKPSFSRVSKGVNKAGITGLTSNTDYIFEIVSFSNNKNENYKKSDSKKVSFKTLVDRKSEKPSPPSPTINFISSNKAEIIWENVQNLGTKSDGTSGGLFVVHYKYRYYEKSDINNNFDFIETSNNSVLIEGLKSNTDYVFEIMTTSSHIDEKFKESIVMTYNFSLEDIKNIITITDENNAENISMLMLSGDGNTAPTLTLNYTLNDNVAESNAVITVEAQAKSGDDNLGVVESEVAADRLSGIITYTAPSTFDNSKETVDVVVSIAIDNPEGEDSYPKASRTIRLIRPMLTAIELPESTEASPLVFKQGASDVQTVAVTTVPSGAKVIYTSDPELPKGLTINPNTGIISGTPENSMISPSAYTIIATPTSESAYSNTNTVRAVAYIKIRALLKSITANNVQSLIYTGSQVTVASFTKLPANATVTYSVSGLPAGLDINDSTGVISGTPTTALADGNYSRSYRIIAEANGDYYGRRSVDIIFEIGSTLTGISIPGDASTQANPLAYNEGQTITATSAVTTTPANIPATYSITSPSTGLPSGLSLNSSTGVISGTPTGSFNASTKYTITGTATGNNRGSASTDVYIKIRKSLKSVTANGLKSVVYQGNNAGTVVSFTIVPANAKVIYSVAPALPDGLILNPNGTITGKPTVEVATRNYTITAQGNGDYHGSRTSTIISLESRPIVITVIVEQSRSYGSTRNLRLVGNDNSQYNYSDWEVIVKNNMANLELGSTTDQSNFGVPNTQLGSADLKYVGSDFKGLKTAICNFRPYLATTYFSLAFRTSLQRENEIILDRGATRQGTDHEMELDIPLSNSLAGNPHPPSN